MGYDGLSAFMGRPTPSSYLRLRALAEVLTASRPDAIGFLRSICELQRGSPTLPMGSRFDPLPNRPALRLGSPARPSAS